jgi:transposase
MLRMDQVHVFRHKVLVEGRSQRAVARELGLARVTVRRYLEQAAPGRKAEAPRPRPVWDAVAQRVQALLADSVRWTGGKQRLTATRLHELLLAEGKRVGVTIVKEAVAVEATAPRGLRAADVSPGDLAEVDFFEVLVDVDGTRRKAWLFLIRLMYSGRDFAWIYERQDQISFLDGHVRAFAHFDGVPARVAYDNLRAAVIRILVGGVRTLTPRFARSPRTIWWSPVSAGRARAMIKAASNPVAKPCGSRRSSRFPSARRSPRSTRSCWRRRMRGSTPSAMRRGKRSARALPRSTASAARS